MWLVIYTWTLLVFNTSKTGLSMAYFIWWLRHGKFQYFFCSSCWSFNSQSTKYISKMVPYVAKSTVKQKAWSQPSQENTPVPELVYKSPTHSAVVPWRETYLYVHCRDSSHFSFNSSSLMGILERAAALAALVLYFFFEVTWSKSRKSV